MVTRLPTLTKSLSRLRTWCLLACAGATLQVASAQCPTQDIELRGQAAIDNFSLTFRNCTDLTGDLTLLEDPNDRVRDLDGLSRITSVAGDLSIGTAGSGDDLNLIRNLDGLDNLRSVGGTLTIYSADALQNVRALSSLESVGIRFLIDGGNFNGGHPSLTQISGLSSFRSVGTLAIENNSELTSIEGFSSLTDIGGTLSVFNNRKLTTLLGLEGVSEIGVDLAISNNDALTDLEGLSNVTFIGDDVRIRSNPLLTSLAGLRELETIGGDFEVSNSDRLRDFNGLSSVTSVGGNLTFLSNNDLRSFEGLENLESFGGTELVIQNNRSLSDISAIFNLGATQGPLTKFVIFNNPQLATCSLFSVCTFLRGIGEAADIGANASGCNSVAELQTACDSPLPVELVSFNGERDASGDVLLSWTTYAESDLAGFDVSRSADLQTWEPLGTVAAEGAAAGSTYSYAVVDAPSAATYYRLRAEDLDGTVSAEEVVAIAGDLDSEAALAVYPTVANAVVHLELDAPAPGSTILLRDATGRTALETPAVSGDLSVAHLNPGHYVLELRDAALGVTSRRIYVQH